MAQEIDLKQRVVDELIATGKKDGLEYYDVHITELHISIAFVATPTRVTPIGLQAQKEIALENCTGKDQQEKRTSVYEWTDEFEWQLDSSLKLDQKVSAEVDLPGLGKLDAEVKQELAVAIQAHGKKTRHETETTELVIVAPPCSKVTAIPQIVRTKSSGDLTLKVSVRGKAKGMLKVHWGFDAEVFIPIFQAFEISGTFDGIAGEISNTSFNQQKIQCPPGSPCNPTTTGGGAGAGSGGSGEDGGDVQPMRQCGDKFTIEMSGEGNNQDAAQQDAQTKADAKARLQCPGRCPARRTGWSSQFRPGKKGQTICDGKGNYVCAEG
jgi:hypothetical protein